MVNKTFLVLMCLVGLIIFASTLYNQRSKRTITLPSGELICDLNGEWDAIYEHHRHGKSTDVLKITQRDGSFEGVRTIQSVSMPENAVSIKGELSKDGIAKFQVVMQVIYSGDPGRMTETQDLIDCKGQISEDGSEIIIDGGETIRVTLSRE
jgi:hypothetical protein